MQIDFTISNRNLLGPHHCTDIHNCYGSNPFAWELSNDWVKDEKNGYRSSYELLKLCADG